ncbi:MAG: hypothetical protein QXX17_01320 [Conexivisphaerales archaeon]
MMKKMDDASERLAGQILLDIKAFMIIQESDIKARQLIDRLILESHDEYINRFLRLFSRERSIRRGALVLAAIGELLLSSFLILGGFVLLAPAIAGFTTPNQLYNYFVQILTYLTSNGPLFPFARIIGFAIAALLLLAAVFTLRLAATSLSESGLMVQAGGE